MPVLETVCGIESPFVGLAPFLSPPVFAHFWSMAWDRSGSCSWSSTSGQERRLENLRAGLVHTRFCSAVWGELRACLPYLTLVTPGRFSIPDLFCLGFSTEISDPQARQVLSSSQWNLHSIICFCRYLRLFDKFGSCGWVLGGEPELGLCCRV